MIYKGTESLVQRSGCKFFNLKKWLYEFRMLKHRSGFFMRASIQKLIVLLICCSLFEQLHAQELSNSGMVRALAMKDRYLFAATDSGLVFRSSDGAKTWSAFRVGKTDLCIWSLLVKGDSLWAGTGNGAFYSMDNGEHWTKSDDGLGYTSIYALTQKDNNIFAGGYGNAFRLKGSKWEGSIRWINTENGFQDYYCIVYAIRAKGNLLFAGTDHGIYQSNDNGDNWRSININLPANIIVTALFVAKDKLYAGTGNGIFYLDNNGKCWNPVKGMPENTCIYSFSESKNEIFAGTSNGLFYSMYGDESWNEVKTILPPQKVVIYSLFVSGNSLWVGSAGSVVSVPLNVMH